MKTALAVFLLLVPAVLFAQTGHPLKTAPLTVCEVLSRPGDWDNNVVLIYAHYGSGMEDSFLWDPDCKGMEMEFLYPDLANNEDELLRDTMRNSRTQVSLKHDEKWREFENLLALQDEKKMCQKWDIVIEATGRVDTKRNPEEKNPNCKLPFGMCNYRARFVVASFREVRPLITKPMCK